MPRIHSIPPEIQIRVVAVLVYFMYVHKRKTIPVSSYHSRSVQFCCFLKSNYICYRGGQLFFQPVSAKDWRRLTLQLANTRGFLSKNFPNFYHALFAVFFHKQYEDFTTTFGIYFPTNKRVYSEDKSDPRPPHTGKIHKWKFNVTNHKMI